MTRERIIETLNVKKHRGREDWSEELISEDESGLFGNGGSALLTWGEAYGIVKEYDKVDHCREWIEVYLHQRRKIVISRKNIYARIVPVKDRRTRLFTWQEKVNGEMVSVDENIELQTTYDRIVSAVGPCFAKGMIGDFFHYSKNERGLKLEEFAD